MKKYLIVKRTSQSIGTLRGEVLWNSKKEAEQQIRFQQKLYEAKVKATEKFWGKGDCFSIPFPKCVVVEIEIPEELINYNPDGRKL